MIAHRTLLIILLFMPLFSSCSKDTDDMKVKKVVTDVQQAAQQKKISGVLDHISKSYRDPQGNDYNDIKETLAFYFFRHQKVSVYIPSIDVVVSGSAAQAMFQAVMTGRGTGGDILPEALGAYNFEVHLAKEDSAWKVTSAKWEPAGKSSDQPQ